MKTRKNHILSLLIVGVLAAIGTSAADTYAVIISVKTKALLAHPALPNSILLKGTGNVEVLGATVNLGNFYMNAPKAKALIDWSPTSLSSSGWFKAYGSGRAKFKNPSTGAIEFVSFRMVSRGRTDSVGRAVGRFVDIYASVPGAGLKGKYRH